MPSRPKRLSSSEEIPAKSIFSDINLNNQKTLIEISRAKRITMLAKKSADRAIKLAVVVARSDEFAAMCLMLDHKELTFSLSGRENDPHLYVVGTIDRGVMEKPRMLIVVQTIKMGNNAAAIAATQLKGEFKAVRDVLMVGVAGGIPAPDDPKNHVRLGDIVISSDQGVIQYDMVKDIDGELTIRSSLGPPSQRLTAMVNYLESERISGRRPWENHIHRASKINGFVRPKQEDDVIFDVEKPSVVIDHPVDPERNPNTPKVHRGLIASANVLLKNASRRAQLRRIGVVAVEMEGAGIADAADFGGMGYLVIRGISDYCDINKNDIWKEYAALAAAAYARALLECIPDQ